MVYGLEWLTGPPQPKVEPVRAKSADGGYVAPDRSSRERCYESRNIFFECLDKHDILDANKHDTESRQKCPKEVADYERDCAKSWVSCGSFGCMMHLGMLTLDLHVVDKILQRKESDGVQSRRDDREDQEG